MAHRPMDTILPVVDGRMEVKITGKELLSEINSSLPSQDIMEYLLSVSTYTDPQVRMRIVLDDEVDLEETRKIYSSYAFLMARKNSKELRAYTFKIISFVLFGALVLTLSYFMENTMKRVIADSVNIIGGFSIWEAADLFFFARQDKKKELMDKMMPYQLNDEFLEGSHALVFHDMPMHVGFEISKEVEMKNLDHILDQAENRRHAEKAVMYTLIKGI